MTHVGLHRRRGLVVMSALAGLLILMVVSALFLQYGVQGLRQEHMQSVSAHYEQIVLSLRELSRHDPTLLTGERREISIADLLPPGAEGAAWLGAVERPDGGNCFICRVQIELGRDRLDRTIEWPVAAPTP